MIVRKTALISSLATLSTLALALSPMSASANSEKFESAKHSPHVLLLSVDGMHQSDLDWYVKAHPQSAIARLVNHGTSYTHAQTPVPSDSFPGMVAQATGGNPGTTGIYYDDTYNRVLLPAGTKNCATAVPGTEVAMTEAADRDPLALDAGQGLTGLPARILSMTSHPESLLNPVALPVDPATCRPVLPHQYLQVNTIFEVAKAAGMVTAWADKHPAYEILSGPSGTGLTDLFTPEINSASVAPYSGADWTKDNAATQQYDGYKVQAVLNEIAGKDHSGTKAQAVPGIFGMNFQSVSTAEKLPKSDGLSGGYLPGGTVPGPLLSKALDFVNASVAKFEGSLSSHGLDTHTTIILSAKHGQSPTDPAALTRVPDSTIIDALNAAWAKTHPGTADLVVFSTDDDIMQLWLSVHTQQAADFAKKFLAHRPATGNTITGGARTLSASGLSMIYAGCEVAKYFGAPENDARYPDILGLVQTGVVFTGGMSKIAEHGGAASGDRNVPLVVAQIGGERMSRSIGATVETTQIAPTILAILGLDPQKLQAVRIEHTATLPTR